MRCWNCDRKIPDDAKACRYCEAPVEPAPPPEALEAVQEVFDSLDDESRKALMDAFDESMTAEEFANMIMVGQCPKCGSQDVGDCDADPEINDICVGRCYQCGQLWCIECESLFKPGQVKCDKCEDD